MILAGDIGGTKVNLALFQEKNRCLTPVKEAKFESRKYPGLESILKEFCQEKHPRLERACFGVAGPVKEGKCEVTNLPWIVEVASLKAHLNLDDVWLINDLAAMACSVPFLDPSEVEILQAGLEDENGRITIVAAGTGLGEAFLMPDGQGRYLILDSEGGHVDFAPRNKAESELFFFLRNKFSRVSYERVLSGPGLFNIYQFILEHHQITEPDWLAREIREGEPGVVITQNAITKKSSACAKALEMFVSIYGAVAGNLALQFLTFGGVYIGGGIAPNILSLIKQGLFMESFQNKGRFSNLIRRMPVKVILNEKASLLGAAHFALGEKFVR